MYLRFFGCALWMEMTRLTRHYIRYTNGESTRQRRADHGRGVRAHASTWLLGLHAEGLANVPPLGSSLCCGR